MAKGEVDGSFRLGFERLGLCCGIGSVEGGEFLKVRFVIIIREGDCSQFGFFLTSLVYFSCFCMMHKFQLLAFLKAIKYAQPFSLFVFYIAHFALATVNFL
jgi:hypothetical protein